MIIISFCNNHFNLEIDAPTESAKRRNQELIKKIPGNKFSRKESCYTVPLLELKSMLRILKNNCRFVGDRELIKNAFNRALIEFQNSLDYYSPKTFLKTLDINYNYDFLKIEPKSYQKTAIEWIASKKGNEGIYGGLIADEVGLGKTFEALGGICKLKFEGLCDKGIILCPATVKLQWKEEIDSFTNESVRVINSGPKNKRINNYKEFNETFLIMSYDIYKKDIDDILALQKENDNLNFTFIILDESHKIKNRERLTFKKVSLINPKVKILLTATPAKKDISDIFTQFHYINPKIFGSWEYFRVKFLNCIKIRGKIVPISGKKEALPLLHKMILPYMLRRKASEVSSEIPELITYNIPVEPTKEQNKWFDIIKKDMEKSLEAAKEAYAESNIAYAKMKENVYKAHFNTFSAASDHLYLIKSSSSKILQSLVKKNPIKDLSSPKVDWVLEFIENNIISSNELFDDLNEKVVIFTKFERMARLLEDIIVTKFSKTNLVNPVLFTGEMKKGCQNLKSGKSINCTNCEYFLDCSSVEKSKFLFINNSNTNIIICTDSAQAGVNLQVARYIINFDLLYSPGDIEQRNGRIKRLNSKYKTVISYNLYTVDSMDENIISKLQARKKSIDEVIEVNKEEKRVCVN